LLRLIVKDVEGYTLRVFGGDVLDLFDGDVLGLQWRLLMRLAWVDT
jgi:hypothetical protein